MSKPTIPTEEGLRRYSSTNGYNLDAENPGDLGKGYPCTCEPTCPRRCAGECGCEACSLQFAMFCDVAGLSGPEPWTPADQVNAFNEYRAKTVR
jgi:hypothetical protein